MLWESIWLYKALTNQGELGLNAVLSVALKEASVESYVVLLTLVTEFKSLPVLWVVTIEMDEGFMCGA